MYKLNFYVPGTHLDLVKEALFAAGAGTIGRYERCSWQVLGQGQFLPGQGSKPFIGEVGTVEQVDEYRVEMMCTPDCVPAALKALKRTHPYEQPAWDLVQAITEFPT